MYPEISKYYHQSIRPSLYAKIHPPIHPFVHAYVHIHVYIIQYAYCPPTYTRIHTICLYLLASTYLPKDTLHNMCLTRCVSNKKKDPLSLMTQTRTLCSRPSATRSLQLRNSKIIQIRESLWLSNFTQFEITSGRNFFVNPPLTNNSIFI